MQVQDSAIPNEGCIAFCATPNGATRMRNSRTTGSVTCSPAFMKYFTDDRSHILSSANARRSLTRLKPKLGAHVCVTLYFSIRSSHNNGSDRMAFVSTWISWHPRYTSLRLTVNVGTT